MNVLLTGATGFIGSQIARHLIRNGYSVRAVIREESSRSRIADIEGGLEIVTGDVFRDAFGDPDSYVDGVDLCIHAAWYAEPGKYHHSDTNIECVTGSLRLLRALIDAGCKKSVFVGSCFEYDFAPGYLDESSPLRPASLYAAAKASTSMMAEAIAARDDHPFAWTRVFYLYGPWEDERRLVPYLIKRLLNNEVAELTSGNQVRDFMHVEDVASAIVQVATRDVCGPVNIGSGNPATVRDIVNTIARNLEKESLVQFGARPDNPTDPPIICARNEKLLSTGWKPAYSLESGLAQTIAWWETALSDV